jgi:hypothetical protein
MAAGDPLERVLNLVAEGRVSAEEAASILAALDDRPGTAAGSGTGNPGERNRGGSAGSVPPRDRPPGGSGFNSPPSGDAGGGGAASLRLEVRESGRQVVNLRLPIAVGRLALERVPGLSGEQVDRVREALNGGLRGPVLEVEDGDNIVRIVLE